MRRPRLLALLILFAALLALGVWTLMPAHSSAFASTLASAPEHEAQSDAPLALEPELAPQRQDAAVALAPAAPLANSDRIRGRVVRGRVAIPVAGVVVDCSKIAAPTRRVGPVRIDLGARFQTEEPGPSCTSGPDGSFEFKQLDRGALYTLSAGGSGWMLLEPLAAIAPSEDERTLTVGRIYVARVLATDENDVPIDRGCQYLRYARVPGPGECKSMPCDSSPPRLEPGGRTAGAVYEFASDCDAPSLGPFRILICCSGFERQDFEFWAYPKGFRSDATTFRLRRSQDKAGMLRVHQECGCGGASCEHLLEGRLDLEALDGTQNPQSFDLEGLVREQLFTNVPAGRWRARVHAKYGGFCYPAADQAAVEITIGDEPALLPIAVADLGAIHFVVQVDGERLEEIPLAWQGQGGTTSLWTSLVMRGVVSGSHTFESTAASCGGVEGARYTASGEKVYIAVDVVPGETRTVTIHPP
jgi:hypothetical protein